MTHSLIYEYKCTGRPTTGTCITSFSKFESIDHVQKAEGPRAIPPRSSSHQSSPKKITFNLFSNLNGTAAAAGTKLQAFEAAAVSFWMSAGSPSSLFCHHFWTFCTGGKPTTNKLKDSEDLIIFFLTNIDNLHHCWPLKPLPLLQQINCKTSFKIT